MSSKIFPEAHYHDHQFIEGRIWQQAARMLANLDSWALIQSYTDTMFSLVPRPFQFFSILCEKVDKTFTFFNVLMGYRTLFRMKF